jgi:BirA family transcriptional regulator, biotin operon repressor / biotin---[acetyl-CoA-carboxylase] ligase
VSFAPASGPALDLSPREPAGDLSSSEPAGALSAPEIKRLLERLGARVGPVLVAPETGSTNDDARRAAARGAPSGSAFLAEAQTHGRGRGGHSWHSPPGENLYLSLLVRPAIPAASLAPLALAAGVAVAEIIEARLAALADALRVPVRIKWPNDVLAGGRKVAGILVEGQLRGDTVQSLVLGVGVNVRARSFPEEITARATSLALLGCEELDRSSLAAELLAALAGAVSRYEASGLQSFAEALAARDALRGRRLSVGEIGGLGAGIDEGGRLLIVPHGGGAPVPVTSGEISVSLDAP